MKTPLFFITLFFLKACATNLSGSVFDLSEKPIYTKDAKINIVPLSPKNGAKAQIISLNKDGSFSTEKDLIEGEYLIEPLIPGYESQSIRTHIKEHVHLKIQLKNLKKADTSTIKANMDVTLGRGAGKASLTPPKY